jgi:hypothetical protein
MRPAAFARLLLGGGCLLAPGAVLTLVGGPDREDRHVRTIARILGGRLVAQAAADLALGSRTRKLDIAVDVTHAASMLAAAMRWPAHRRSALASAGFATVAAVLDAADTVAGPAKADERSRSERS